MTSFAVWHLALRSRHGTLSLSLSHSLALSLTGSPAHGKVQNAHTFWPQIASASSAQRIWLSLSSSSSTCIRSNERSCAGADAQMQLVPNRNTRWMNCEIPSKWIKGSISSSTYTLLIIPQLNRCTGYTASHVCFYCPTTTLWPFNKYSHRSRQMYFYNLWPLLKLFSNIAFECAFERVCVWKKWAWWIWKWICFFKRLVLINFNLALAAAKVFCQVKWSKGKLSQLPSSL